MEKNLTLEASATPLGQLLKEAGRQGGFYFSYNSNVLPEDSLVTVSVRNTTVRELLDQLLSPSLEYLEAGNYVIIRLRGRSMALTLKDITEQGNAFLVSGIVSDTQTGRGLPEASVYERQLLLSTLTDQRGHFLLRVKDRYATVALTASKALYEDTTMFVQLRGVVVLPGKKQGGKRSGAFYGEGENGEVERTGLGRFLVSSRQRIQSLNLRGFFTESPVQASLTPGLSSQGSMSAQVINKFSMNLIGGYTAGVDGVEMAGLFNINRKSVRHLQLAGAFSVVGGAVEGVQAAGIHNLVLDSVNGVQAAGAYNHVKGGFSGVQLSGAGNLITGHRFNGVQAAGGFNFVKGAVSGIQIAGVINYAQHLKGVQLGIVNIADSSSGYSIGLVNVVRKNGYLKVHLFSTESFQGNLAFKSGTSKIYAILQGGANAGGEKLYAYGAGLGTQIMMKGGITVQPELLFQEVYQGSSDYNNHLYRFDLGLHYPLGKTVQLFAGPSFNVWNSNQATPVNGYGFIPSARKGSFSMGGRLRGWIGWSAGISLL